jgi:HSP20 family protein
MLRARDERRTAVPKKRKEGLATLDPWQALFGRFGLPERWEGFAPSDMRIEEFREGGDYVLRVEMPGVDPEKDVDVSIVDGTLTVKAERREESHDEESGVSRSEFRYGSFTRQVELPVGATDEDVKATYADGILEVRVPLREEAAAARKIPIARH